jgi:hypothetical protein
LKIFQLSKKIKIFNFKQKPMQNNEYNILEMKVKNDKNLHFFLFFLAKPIAKIGSNACKMQICAM